MLLDKKSKILLAVERAINDIRKGLPIIISTQDEKIIALSPETILKDIFNNLFGTESLGINLTISKNRLNYINKNTNSDANGKIDISSKSIDEIAGLCGLEEFKETEEITYSPTSNADNAALELVKLAELIPSVITFKATPDYLEDELAQISEKELSEYQKSISLEINEACRTKLVLKGDVPCEIIAYRPNIGGKEHYAMLIGDIVDAPIVRVHSSCYTGDLLNSLACDCRDQLHTAIELMHESGGGIILYMLQEGRGIGLINKLRAYTLKEQGFDTVEANESLGFGDDERLFEPAATILKKLNINEIQLLTNNPKKANALSQCGINVIKCVPHIMETNEHNEHYIKTKSTRLGHKIESKG